MAPLSSTSSSMGVGFDSQALGASKTRSARFCFAYLLTSFRPFWRHDSETETKPFRANLRTRAMQHTENKAFQAFWRSSIDVGEFVVIWPRAKPPSSTGYHQSESTSRKSSSSQPHSTTSSSNGTSRPLGSSKKPRKSSSLSAMGARAWQVWLNGR